MTTGRLGNSHADGARGLNAISSALFAFLTACCIPKLRSTPVSAANERQGPAFADKKARPRATSVYPSLLADRAQDPSGQAPTRGPGLALLLPPRGSGLWTSRRPMLALFLRRETLPKENMHEKALFAVIRALFHPAPPGAPSPPRDLDLLLPSPPLFLFFSTR